MGWFSACLPPSLNESWRDVADLHLCYQEFFVFLNIDRIRLQGGVLRMAKIKAGVGIPFRPNPYGLAQLMVPQAP